MTFKVIQANKNDLLQKAFEVRKEVFVDEQKVSTKLEFDEFESISHHFVILDACGKPIGASRWRRTEKGVKLERFAVKKTMRGKGLGSLLVKATLDDIFKHTEKGTYLYMHSQLDAVPLYEKFHFRKEFPLFSECNILHCLMWKRS